MPLADWDFSGAQRALDQSKYVSSPSSLKLTGDIRYLCRKTEALCLPYGRVQFYYFRNSTNRYQAIYFRNQAPLGTVAVTDTYAVNLSTSYTIFKNVAGSQTNLGTFTPPGGVSEWVGLAAEWYQGMDPDNLEALVIDVYKWTGTDWLLLGSGYDTAQSFLTSEINRVGHRAAARLANPVWHDDTQIWRPA